MLVFGKREHADLRVQDHHRVVVAHGRAIGVLAPFIVSRVVFAVGFELLRELLLYLLNVGKIGGSVKVEHERADLGAEEVVGAAGAEGSQLV